MNLPQKPVFHAFISDLHSFLTSMLQYVYQYFEAAGNMN